MSDHPKMHPGVWTPANIVTLIRIGLVPVVALLLHPWGEGRIVPSPTMSLVAGWCFIIAFTGDALDGYLARRYGHITAFGKLLDPLADKLLVLAVMVMLIPLGWIPAWVVALLLFRELLITGLRAVATEEQVVISSSQLGKYKTVYQACALSACIWHYRVSELIGADVPAPLDISFDGVGLVLVYFSTAISLWSGLDYFGKFWRQVIVRAASR